MVMEEVDKMLAQLRQEEMDDITLRDYCQAEEVKVETEIEDMEHKITDLSELVGRLQGAKRKLQEEQTATEAEIASTEDAMAEALSERNAESEEFRAALKDDLDAVEILGKATGALKESQPSLLMQVEHREKRVWAWNKGPEYDDTGAPPDTFSKPYGGPRSQSGGIQEILGYLKEDLENEIILSKEAESKSAAAFETFRATTTETLQALQTKLTSLETQEAETDEKIRQNEQSKESTASMKESKQAYRESLRPKCDWMKEAFQTRRTARQEEMTGLLHAKASLAGAGAGEELELSQQSRQVFLAPK